jgi:two-component system sensor histidine kinase DesK
MSLLLKIHYFLLPQDEDIGYAVYSNLLFLSLFFGNLYFRPVHGFDMVIIIAGLMTFLVLYFRAFAAHKNDLIYYIAAMCFIGVALSEINIGGNL